MLSISIQRVTVIAESICVSNICLNSFFITFNHHVFIYAPLGAAFLRASFFVRALICPHQRSSNAQAILLLYQLFNGYLCIMIFQPDLDIVRKLGNNGFFKLVPGFSGLFVILDPAE